VPRSRHAPKGQSKRLNHEEHEEGQQALLCRSKGLNHEGHEEEFFQFFVFFVSMLLPAVALRAIRCGAGC
jgi:hypothetical protein